MFILMSEHADVRCKQRGFKPVDIDIILSFGEEEIHQNREVYTLTKASFKKMKAYFGKTKLATEKFTQLRGAYVVLEGNDVVTVAHQSCHFKRDR